MCSKISKFVLSFGTVRRRERRRHAAHRGGRRGRVFAWAHTACAALFFFFFCGPARARAHPPPPPIVPPSSFLQVVGAAAVAAIIAIKLQAVTWSNLTSVRTLPCALWAGTGGQACVYGYTVAGVSIAAAAAISLLQCCTCDLCGLGPLLDFVFEVAAAAWWGIASGVFWRYTSDADGAGVPGGEWRQRVNWAAWGVTAAFALMALISIGRAIGRCCGR